MRLVLAAAAAAALVLVAPGPAAAQEAPAGTEAAAASALRTLPIREVSVFKDGHAFVLREGDMPVDAAGHVVLDDLPAPVLGTFWPYAADEEARLRAAVAGQRRVGVESTALTVPELLRANVGAEATFRETGVGTWSGRIVSFPERSGEELRAASAPGAAARLPVRGTLMLVETVEGTRAVEVARIEGVTFKDGCRSSVREEQFRNLLTLQLEWSGPRPDRARVGMVYLQRGLRWIPAYRIDIDGAGNATVRLEATLVNDLADLDRATVHLVVGVPKFDFAHLTDPIALGADAAQTAALAPAQSRLNQMFSNAIQTQVALFEQRAYQPGESPAAPGGELAPELGGAQRNEDLFLFDVKDVTLRRGERMTLPIAEFRVRYEDIHTVDLPMTPPPEVWHSNRDWEQMDRIRLLTTPTALHKLRLTNDSRFPLTTAPAVVLRAGRILGQGLVAYTPAGSTGDVPVTKAVDLRVRKEERETGRTPDAAGWRGEKFDRVDLEGTVRITNTKDRPVELEVTRGVLGFVDRADHGGDVVALNVTEDLQTQAGLDDTPPWWRWLSWPHWWHHVNGAGRVTWKVRLEPGETVTLAYAWHYFWR